MPLAASNQNSRYASAPRWRSGSRLEEKAALGRIEVDEQHAPGPELDRLLLHVVEVALGAVAQPHDDAMRTRRYGEALVDDRVAVALEAGRLHLAAEHRPAVELELDAQVGALAR